MSGKFKQIFFSTSEVDIHMQKKNGSEPFPHIICKNLFKMDHSSTYNNYSYNIVKIWVNYHDHASGDDFLDRIPKSKLAKKYIQTDKISIIRTFVFQKHQQTEEKPNKMKWICGKRLEYWIFKKSITL